MAFRAPDGSRQRGGESLLMSLPLELLLEIVRYLDVREVLRCALASKAFSALIKQSLELQYKIELFADGMIDNPVSVLSIAQRLQVLLDRRKAWERLDIRKSVKLSIHDDCLAYELVGGVFATVGDPSSDHSSLGNSQFIASWLPTASIDEHRVVYGDMGIPVKDFAIDPTQDLLALVERHPDVFGQAMDGLAAPFQGDIRIHLRSLSTNAPHTLARTPILRHPSRTAVSESTTQIAHDVIGMFLSRPFAGLIIWNWKSGETLLHTDHAPQAISDFSFLSPRAYLLTAYDGDGSLEIFTFSNDEVNATAAHHAATLRLPPLTVEAGIGRINTHTGPFTARIPRDAPFDVDSDTRIHVLTLFYVRPVGRMVRLIVDHRVFLPYINQHRNGGVPIVKAWKEWGPKHSRAFRFRQWSHWLRYVHGRRVVFPEVGAGIRILDFSRNCLRPITSSPAPPARLPLFDPDQPVSATSTYPSAPVTAPSCIPAESHFLAPLETRLPFRALDLKDPAFEHGIMVDGERLIGFSRAAAEDDALGDMQVACF